MARTDALERAPGNFRRLLAGYFQALDHLHTSPDDAFRRMAPRQGMRPEEVRAAQQGIRFMDLAGNRRWLGGDTPGLVPATQNVARIMVASGLLKRMPDLDGLTDARFLPEGA